MMFNLTHPLPDKYYVACSGGVDSMAVLHWSAVNRNRVLGAIYIHYGLDDFDDYSESVVRDFCLNRNILAYTYKVDGVCPPGRSKEDWWREKRYEVFSNISDDVPIVLGHNFDDCLEEYLMCVLVRGYQDTIGYSNGKCIRPFRRWKRSSILEYARRNNLIWAEDPGNLDVDFKRNYIRHHVVPSVKVLNPGIYNIVERLIVNS